MSDERYTHRRAELINLVFILSVIAFMGVVLFVAKNDIGGAVVFNETGYKCVNTSTTSGFVKDVPQKLMSYSVLYPDTDMILVVDKNLVVSRLFFRVNKLVEDVTFYATIPRCVEFPSKNVYEYFIIEKENVANLNFEDLRLEFVVNNSWADKYKYVTLKKYNKGSWDTVKTKLNVKGKDVSYFVSYMDGFSTFAIVGIGKKFVPEQSLNTSSKSIFVPGVEKKMVIEQIPLASRVPPVDVLVLGVIIVLLALASFLLFKFSKKPSSTELVKKERRIEQQLLLKREKLKAKLLAERRKELIKREKLANRSKVLIGFLRSLGLFKTIEEKREIARMKEREKLRRLKQKELENRRKEIADRAAKVLATKLLSERLKLKAKIREEEELRKKEEKEEFIKRREEEELVRKKEREELRKRKEQEELVRRREQENLARKKEQEGLRNRKELEELAKKREKLKVKFLIDRRKELIMRERSAARRKMVVGLLRSLGLFKTADERKEIARIKEREKLRKVKQLEIERKKKEYSDRAAKALATKLLNENLKKEAKAKKEEELRKKKEQEELEKELEKERRSIRKKEFDRKDELIKKSKKLESEQENFRLEKESLKKEKDLKKKKVVSSGKKFLSVLHSLGVYKTHEEKLKELKKKAEERLSKLKLKDEEKKMHEAILKETHTFLKEEEAKTKKQRLLLDKIKKLKKSKLKKEKKEDYFVEEDISLPSEPDEVVEEKKPGFFKSLFSSKQKVEDYMELPSIPDEIEKVFEKVSSEKPKKEKKSKLKKEKKEFFEEDIKLPPEPEEVEKKPGLFKSLFGSKKKVEEFSELPSLPEIEKVFEEAMEKHVKEKKGKKLKVKAVEEPVEEQLESELLAEEVVEEKPGFFKSLFSSKKKEESVELPLIPEEVESVFEEAPLEKKPKKEKRGKKLKVKVVDEPVEEQLESELLGEEVVEEKPVLVRSVEEQVKVDIPLLVSIAEKAINSGHSRDEVVRRMREKGWNNRIIDQVLSKVRISKERLLSQHLVDIDKKLKGL